ncbi:MAG: hypothetical protein V4726_10225 [Verrucomicrobiota bacterium]
MTKGSLALLLALAGSLTFSLVLRRENLKLKESLTGNILPAAAPAAKAFFSDETVIPASSPNKNLPRKSVSEPAPLKKTARGPLKVTPGPDGTLLVAGADGETILAATAAELDGLGKQAAAVVMADRIKAPGGPSWSPGQAAGPPDTSDAGDHPTAWAPMAQDGGLEWLQLKYPKAVELSEVTVHESYNAGALTRILAILPDGKEEVLWSGAATADTGIIERVVKVPPGIRSDQIRVELDTARVPGWNEIDAVEILGSDGSRQWAAEATASSYYGQGASSRESGDLRAFSGAAGARAR